MPLSQLPRKVPPGLTFIFSLLLDWRLAPLPAILIGIFKPNFWQTTLTFLATLPVSVGAAVWLKNLHYAKRQKELGADLPPRISSKSFGGLDILKGLRWEYHFGYIGNC